MLSFCYCGIFAAMPVSVLSNLGNGMFVVFSINQTYFHEVISWYKIQRSRLLPTPSDDSVYISMSIHNILKVQTSVLYDMVLERQSTQPFLTRDEIDTIIGNVCSN